MAVTEPIYQTTQDGTVIPRLSTLQRDALPANTIKGWTIFNSDTKEYQYNAGAIGVLDWKTIVIVPDEAFVEDNTTIATPSLPNTWEAISMPAGYENKMAFIEAVSSDGLVHTTGMRKVGSGLNRSGAAYWVAIKGPTLVNSGGQVELFTDDIVNVTFRAIGYKA
jgi:hypothetical protein